MSGHDIIVIGASAGGVEALARIVAGLPADLPAALFVSVHFPSNSTSVLPDILSRVGGLPAGHPEDGEAIVPGRVYIAPPDSHLLVGKGHVHVWRGPKENGHRPAADPMFRTAARSYGPRVVGVVLTGNLDDGTTGLLEVSDQGGVAVVQDPEEALFGGMPRSALENVHGALCLLLDEIAPFLVRMAHEAPEEKGESPVPEPSEQNAVRRELVEEGGADNPLVRDRASGLTCPECSGSLWEIPEGDMLRFRCRVGHSYSVDSLLTAQTETLEAALWSAINALEEKADLATRMARRLGEASSVLAVERFRTQASESRRQARILRDALLGSGITSTPTAYQETAD
ncbi:MAG: chemotaxis protein CheB [Gemmatimonadetes bacterium]|nr:chemotaxis protein CheB [Gemmatimonadota bacterium]